LSADYRRRTDRSGQACDRLLFALALGAQVAAFVISAYEEPGSLSSGNCAADQNVFLLLGPSWRPASGDDSFF